MTEQNELNTEEQIESETSGTSTPREETGGDELAVARQNIEHLKEQLLRKAAEFENFRRRTREEQSTLILFATESLIRDLLPLLDDFDRSLKAGRDHPDFDSFYKGTEIIRNKLVKMLDQRGLKPIDAIGKHFDVAFHEALLQLPAKDAEPGTVIDVIEPGYMLHDRVIRHAKVAVASDHTGPEGEDLHKNT